LLTMGLYPVSIDIPTSTHFRISHSLWAELVARRQNESLRGLAREYGVSYEAIRRTLAAASREEKENSPGMSYLPS
jgi:hypothetical protein